MADLMDRLENLSPEKKQALIALLEKKNKKETKMNKKVEIPKRAEGVNHFPLSFAQQRLWFIQEFEPESNAYNFPFAYSIKGPLKVNIMEAAVNEIINRHEIWRTTFQYIDGQPVQVVHPYKRTKLEIVDISGLNDAQSDRVLEIAKAEAERLFDIINGPMVRFLLIRKSDTEHVFLITVHHIAFDSWSMEIFLSELSVIYDAFSKEKQHNLESLKIQYADYSVWQRNWFQGEVMDKQLSYWKQRLKGNTQIIDLPTDRPRPKVRNFKGNVLPFTLTQTLSKELRNLSVKENCTLFMTLLAAFKVLLYRYTNQDRITVGTPISNRNHKELESLMGFFVNTLVLCTETADDPTFLELLKRVREVTLGAFQNRDMPFEKLVEELQPERDLSRTALFQVMFNFLNTPKTVLKLDDLSISPFELGGSTTTVDLNLYVWEEEGEIKGLFEYNSDLFNSSTIERMMQHYMILLESIIESPYKKISELSLLSPDEKKQITVEWNETKIEYPEFDAVHRLFEAQVERTPNAPAVSFEGMHYSYRELNERSNQLAHYLISQGIKKDNIVGLFVERSLDIMVGLFGILKSGGAYVPLDTKYPANRIGIILKDAKSQVLITQKALLPNLPKLDGVKVICIDSDWTDIEKYSKDNPGIELSPESLIYVLFTSGSTGKPKGVMVEHRGYLNYIQSIIKRLNLQSPMNFALVSTFAADLGTTNIYAPLFTGGVVHILSYERATDPEKFAEYFKQNKIHAMKLVPSHFEALLAAKDPAVIIPQDKIIFAGEACTWDVVEKVREINPDCVIQNHYGPTEITVAALTYEVPKQLPEYCKNIVPIGRPIGNARVYVLDKNKEPLPVGVAGELYIGGHGVARGYLNRPDLTAEKFLSDPFSSIPYARMYRTGDMVRYMPDGNIEFLGRMDRQIKIRGYRIEPDDIENVLKEYDSIHDAVVMAREDIPGNKKLAAYIVPEKSRDSALDINQIRKYLRSKLPEYMMPSSFVAMQGIPLTPNGKIDFMSLPVPDNNLIMYEDSYIAPQSELEKKIASVWKEILGLPKVGIDDNFFDLGGESFKAIKVVRKISSSLSVMELFKYPTIRELAEHMSADTGEKQLSILQELTRPVTGKKLINLICVPYGGGSAISYQPLANAMPKNCSLFAVELPGHDFSRPDEPLKPLEEVAEKCMDEIKKNVKGPIALYGQCLGGALSIKLAYKIEEAGLELVGVLEAANFPSPRLPGKWFDLWSKIFPSDRWTSDRVYREFLRSIGSPSETNEGSEANFLIKSLRHDNREAEDYYTSVFAIKGLKKLKAPITFIGGEKDRTTEFYQERYKEWEIFSDNVKLKVIKGAGHFFQKHQPDILSQMIIEQLNEWKSDMEGSAASILKDMERQEDNTSINNENSNNENRVKKRKQLPKPSMPLFLFVALGQIISMIGTSLSGFAMGIWVYKQTGIVSYYALISVCTLLPSILLSPVAGALADRWDRRKVMIAADVLAAFSIGFVGILLWNHQLQIWHIYIASTLGSVASAFQRPAFLAAIAQLAPKRYLGQANGIAQIGIASGTMLAPILGGMLVLIIDLYGIVMLDCITFAFSILTLLVVRFPNSLFKKREESFVKEIVGGWNYIIKRKSMVVMIGFFIVSNFLMSLATVLVTPVVLTFASAKTLGIVTAANGAGLLVGSLIMSLWGGTRRRADGMVGYVMLSGASLVLLGIRPSPICATLGLFGFGLSIAFIDTHWQILIQSKVGLELQARVFATNEMMAFIMRPLAFFLVGPLSDKVFEPFMSGNTAVSKTIGSLIGTGTGRGMGLILILVGAILAIWGYLGFNFRPLRYMEDLLPDAIPDVIIPEDKDKIQEIADMQLLSKSRSA